MTIGKRIRKLRKDEDMTLETFSKAIGLTKGAISRIEGDSNMPSAKIIADICRTFKVSADYILNGITNNGTGTFIYDVKDSFKTGIDKPIEAMLIETLKGKDELIEVLKKQLIDKDELIKLYKQMLDMKDR